MVPPPTGITVTIGHYLLGASHLGRLLNRHGVIVGPFGWVGIEPTHTHPSIRYWSRLTVCNSSRKSERKIVFSYRLNLPELMIMSEVKVERVRVRCASRAMFWSSSSPLKRPSHTYSKFSPVILAGTLFQYCVSHLCN